MMSIHAAKGLEFKVVFIVGLEEELLPHAKTIEETGTDEEERRLFYVAITRAREKLYFSYPETRTKFNEVLHRQPSVFINEIPEDLLETLDLEEKVAKTDGFGDLLKKWKS
jgi:DNA helicase-2/ATP-dependent DNA helicase PcrA